MIFRQMFDRTSCTYTYLLASRAGGEALLVDPVLDHVDRYVTLLAELDLRLVKAVDTHVHADHITGLGALRDRTSCITVMGKESSVDVVSMRVTEGETITVEGLSLDVIYTPGHTSDSYSFRLSDRVFTGDTLLIRGTGRTDFQNGDARAQYDSLFNKLLRLPDETLVYPAHDYNGNTVSTIAEERAHNPRLQVDSVDQYVEIMASLDLPDPKMMDVAVPANQHIGLPGACDPNAPGALTATDGRALIGRPDVLFVDLREDAERARNGFIPGSLHIPYPQFCAALGPHGALHRAVASRDSELVLYCAYGERSAMALSEAWNMGIGRARHLTGGMDAWLTEDGPVETVQ